MIEILEAAETKRLLSLEDLKCRLEISDAGDDLLLESMLDAASQFIVEYTGREFARERVKETIPGYGDTKLNLSRGYVDTITSVLHDSSVITDYIIDNAERGILYRASGWAWTAGVGFNLTSRQIAGTEEPRFVIDYYGGYWLSSFEGAKPAAAVNLPSTLEQVVVDIVNVWYSDKKASITPGTENIRIGDYSVKFNSNNGVFGDSNALPKVILGKLERWRRIF